MSSTRSTVMLALALAGLASFVQAAAAQESSAVAYVYVANTTTGGVNYIHGYYASSTGTLTAMPGSPFPVAACRIAPHCGLGSIALNGNWLFGTDGYDIDVFSMAANGSLQQIATHQVGVLSKTSPPSAVGGPTSVFLDHSGATLYTGDVNLSDTGNNGYESYRIDQPTGQIARINEIQGGLSYGSALAFIGNNEFAYSSSCYHGTHDIFGFERMSDGGLAPLDGTAPFPKPWTGNHYCPLSAAADPTNHLVIAVQPTPNGEPEGTGPYQLASYTVNTSTGTMTTTSTYANMPTAKTGTPSSYWLSPDALYFAIGGSTGLQVFHFNGAAPLTAFTGLLTGEPIDHIWWDNNHHLYAVSQKDSKLFVFTINSSGATPAPGSPHAITGPAAVMALPQ